MLKISLGEGSDKRAHKHLSSFSGWEILSDFIASIGTAGGSNERVLDGSYVPRRMGRDQTSVQRQDREAREGLTYNTWDSHASIVLSSGARTERDSRFVVAAGLGLALRKHQALFSRDCLTFDEGPRTIGLSKYGNSLRPVLG